MFTLCGDYPKLLLTEYLHMKLGYTICDMVSATKEYQKSDGNVNQYVKNFLNNLVLAILKKKKLSRILVLK